MPDAGEHAGVDGPIEPPVGMGQRNEDGLFRSDRAAQYGLAEVEVQEDEGGVLLPVFLDEAQHRGGVFALRLEVTALLPGAQPPFGAERGDRSEQVQPVQVAADAAGRPAPFLDPLVPVAFDGFRTEPPHRHAVVRAHALGIVLRGRAEHPHGRRQHLDVVVGDEPFGQHAAVRLRAAVHLRAVADDDKSHFFLHRDRNFQIKLVKISQSDSACAGKIQRASMRGCPLYLRVRDP